MFRCQSIDAYHGGGRTVVGLRNPPLNNILQLQRLICLLAVLSFCKLANLIYRIASQQATLCFPGFLVRVKAAQTHFNFEQLSGIGSELPGPFLLVQTAASRRGGRFFRVCWAFQVCWTPVC